jgi:serine protease inhibitor
MDARNLYMVRADLFSNIIPAVENGDTQHLQNFAVPFDSASVPVEWYLPCQLKTLHAFIRYLQTKTGATEDADSQQDANWACSPFSLMCCLAMVVAGGTKAENSDGILKNSCEDCMPYCFPDASLGLEETAVLASLKEFCNKLRDAHEVFKCANILVQSQNQNKQMETYNHKLQEYFNAESFPSRDFAEVNKKVREITGLEKKVLGQEPSGTVVINCIYLKNKWAKAFDKITNAMCFETFCNKQVIVEMMQIDLNMTFVQNKSMIAVRLPYESRKHEPSGMYAWFVKGSDANHADEAFSSFLNLNFEGDGLERKVEYTRLKIPKFEVTSTIDIKEVLHKDASVFESGNLKGMSGDASEYVNKFEQVCRLQVDQEGTIASAVSAAGTSRGPTQKPLPLCLTFGCTFYMLIEYNKTILFAAKIGQPPVFAASNVVPAKEDSRSFYFTDNDRPPVDTFVYRLPEELV